jgi:1-acyl-sn-glycerol-3-phosphate acyltransferase
MRTWEQRERLVRSTVLGTPFTLSNLMTRFEFHGRQRLLQAVERSRRTGKGLITVSNHQSLFDDPMVLSALLGIADLSVESKIWYSTPCQTNFSPKGKSFKARFVRYFSDVSNMVFFTRPAKKGTVVEVPESYLEAMHHRGGDPLTQRIKARASLFRNNGEDYLRRFVTPGDPARMAPLNQAGMVEACARINTGDWLHFFPEGGRSRDLKLRSPKRGVGKVIYHCDHAEVVPFCFYGMDQVLPIGAALPRPFKRVVVSVGEPIPTEMFTDIRRMGPTPEAYQALTREIWAPIEALREPTLARQQDRPVDPQEAEAELPPARPAFPVISRVAGSRPRRRTARIRRPDFMPGFFLGNSKGSGSVLGRERRRD